MVRLCVWSMSVWVCFVVVSLLPLVIFEMYHHLPLSGEGDGNSVVSDLSDVVFDCLIKCLKCIVHFLVSFVIVCPWFAYVVLRQRSRRRTRSWWSRKTSLTTPRLPACDITRVLLRLCVVNILCIIFFLFYVFECKYFIYMLNKCVISFFWKDRHIGFF